jgi:hypothetical protein
MGFLQPVAAIDVHTNQLIESEDVDGEPMCTLYAEKKAGVLSP